MKIKKYAIGAMAAGAAAIMCSEYEKKHLEVVNYEIKTPKLQSASGMKAIFLSDLHCNSFGEENEELLMAINHEKPDIILIGGDMLIVKEWQKPDFSQLEQLFEKLSEKYPVYYALGNHEQRMKEEAATYPGWWEAYKEILKKSSVKMLVNKSAIVKKNGQTIRISGITLPHECYRKGRVPKISEGYIRSRIGRSSDDEYEILLAHSPLFADAYADWGADLVLCGHFHGGTIRLPILGGIMTPQLQFFSKLSRGCVIRKNTRLIISGGLGTHSINIRLNNRPQLVVLNWS